MKKITFLLLFFTTITFAQTNKAHRLKKAFATTENAAKTSACTNSGFSSWTYKFDISINTKFPVGTLLYLETGNVDDRGYYYVIFSKDTGWSDEDENFSGSFFTVIPLDCDNDGVPNNQDNCINASNATQSDVDNDGKGDACDTQDNRDTDADGIQNYLDQCPTQAGPSSNNGCPLPAPTGPAKIEIQKVVVKKQGTTVYNSSTANSTLTLNNNNFYDIEITLKNTGGTTQQRIQWVIAESSNNSLSVSNDCINTGGGSANMTVNLAPGASLTATRGIDVYSGKIGQCTARSSGFLMIAATTEALAFAVPYTYSSSSSLKANINFDKETQNELESYTIYIYNFQGQKVLSKEVSSIEDENALVVLMPKGMYILKSPKGDRKVLID